MNEDLNKYEWARIIGARALQIAQGAVLLIKKPEDMMDPVDIALEEAKQNKIPINVRRPN